MKKHSLCLKSSLLRVRTPDMRCISSGDQSWTNASAALARLASSFLFIGVEKGDFSVMAAAIVA